MLEVCRLCQFMRINYTVFLWTYISCWSLFILCNAALQVERQVMTADQDSLPELLFKLPHVWLNAREIQFLWKQEMSKTLKNNTHTELTGFYSQVLSSSPVCQGPEWTVSGELRSSFWTRYLWRSVGYKAKKKKGMNFTERLWYHTDHIRGRIHSIQA